MKGLLETELLLLCARVTSKPERIQELLQRPLAWDTVLEKAERSGIGPLVFKHLKNSAKTGQVPGPILEQFEALYYWTAVHNEDLLERLRDALHALDRERIPVIVLKGAMLATQVYPKPALRTMGDIDLLVPAHHLAQADRVIQSLGYVQRDTGFLSAEEYRLRHHHLNPLMTEDGRFVIELHHHIVPPTSSIQLPIDDLWQRSNPAQIASVPTRILGREDVLLHLCLHLCADLEHGAGLRMLCDIGETTRRFTQEIDWSHVLRAARSYGMIKHLSLALWLAQRTVAAAVPMDVTRSLDELVRPDSLEHRVLKFVTTRVALGQDDAAVGIPAWVLKVTREELLQPGPPWQNCRHVLARIWREFASSGDHEPT